MGYLDTKFSYFPANIKITKPLGEISLLNMLKAVKSPKSNIIKLFEDISIAASEGDLKKKAELKSKLYYFVIPVKLDGLGRSYSNIESFNGLAILDFDGLEHEHAKEFQKYVFEKYPFIIATMISSSRKGIKAIVNIDKVGTVEEFKSIFYALGAEFEKYQGFDGTSQNPVLSFYLTHSPELLYREDATVFKGRGYKESSFKVFEGEFEPVEDISEDDRQHCKAILKSGMDKITDSGHFICRSVCLAGFGYAGAGYFDPEEMRQYLYELIDENDYLQKSLQTYKKTCDDMMPRGLASPLFLEKHKNNG